MVNFGIIGFGGMGHVHANSIWMLENTQVKAVCDINPAQLEKQDIKFNIEQPPNQFDISTSNTYSDAREMLQKEDLDAVVIALPTCLHAEYSIMAMDCGCHVFCEKPMAMNADECDQMIAARDRNGVQFMIAQCLRFWPEYEYLLEVLKTKPFGKFHSLIMHREGAYPGVDKTCWFMDHIQSGGAILDLHVHDLDLAQSALGTPARIQACGVTGRTGGIDDLTAIYDYPDDAMVTIRCSWMLTAGFAMSYIAVFEEATLVFAYTPEGNLLLKKRGEENPEYIKVEDESAYLRELRYFVECAAGEHNNERCRAESTRNSIAIVNQEEKIIRMVK